MNLVISWTDSLSGTVSAPPSKSQTHRAIITTSLSDGQSTIWNMLHADDTLATVRACIAFGSKIQNFENYATIQGTTRLLAPAQPVNCGESGSTMRFMIPIATLAEGSSILTGSPGLLRRPVGPLMTALNELGCKCESNQGFPPVTIAGYGIDGGRTRLPGDISSQFLTGLLFACPMARKDVEIEIVSHLESRPYVELTLEFLAAHNIEVDADAERTRFLIPSNQRYSPHDHKITGDFSSTAFLLAAAAITKSEVEIENLNMKTENQPDFAICDLLRRFGAGLRISEDRLVAIGSELQGITVDAADIPDLVPVLAVIGCFASGETRIENAERLKIKESDRLLSTTSELTKMGAKIHATNDSLIIHGQKRLKGSIIDPHNDHRIAMACAVAALQAEGKTLIQNAECINKSYPQFVNTMAKLGARISYAG